MDDTERLIAFVDCADDYAKGHLIIDPFEGDVLHDQFLIDRKQMLGPADNTHSLDIAFGQLIMQDRDYLIDILLSLIERILEFAGQVGIFLRVEKFEGQILQLPFEPVDADTAGQRGIEIHSLPGHLDLGLPFDHIEEKHILQPIHQFHQQDPDIRGDGQQQLTYVLGLTCQLTVVLYFGDPGRACHNRCDILAEFLLQFLGGDTLFQHSVQHAGQNRIQIEVHGGQH